MKKLFLLFAIAVVALCVSCSYEHTINIDGIEMVYVRGNTFTLGALPVQDSEAVIQDAATQSMTVSDFYIGKYEVTQAQWVAIMGTNPSKRKGDDLPVENVSWNEIQEFIARLNALTGESFRLPTETEWEYAARGGVYATNCIYSSSDTVNKSAWYDGNSKGKTHPVGKKRSNNLDLYDMSGNVCEWCMDWYGDYSLYPQTNSAGPSSGTTRVYRGGSWSSDEQCCSVLSRSHNDPDYRDGNIGFRLALQIDVYNTPMPVSDYDLSVLFSDQTMVLVKGGTFTMGTTEEQVYDPCGFGVPTHSVTVSDFYIGRYEVTQAQWRAVMGEKTFDTMGDNVPADYVSWFDANAFIKKLNALTGKRFRLPTEAEWEYAARGGRLSKGYRYSGSDNIDEVAWYNLSKGNSHFVGQKVPNELGIYDMSGNIWEWCSDFWGDYSSKAQINPTGPSTGSYRVLRGGAWARGESDCCASGRSSNTEGIRLPICGFRLVHPAK